MTLEEAIAKAEAVSYLKSAEEYRQLAEWLRELKAVHDEIDDADDEDEIFIGYLRKKMRASDDTGRSDYSCGRSS